VWHRRKTSKFNNKKTVFKGIHYDSKLEAAVARDIDVLIRAKKVLQVEPHYPLILYGKNGNKICVHKVDFLLTFPDGHHEFWEAKGRETDVWRLKRKLTADNYPDIPYVVITAKGTKIYKHK
jgi:hypothetical protein